MASVVALVILLLAVAIVYVTGRRTLAAWVLIVLPAYLCGGLIRTLARGAAVVGQDAFETYEKQLAACGAIFLLSFIAAIRPKWTWLFWLVWLFNAVTCGILVYLVFFWKIFR